VTTRLNTRDLGFSCLVAMGVKPWPEAAFWSLQCNQGAAHQVTLDIGFAIWVSGALKAATVELASCAARTSRKSRIGECLAIVICPQLLVQ